MLQHPTDVDDPAKQVALDCLAAGIRAADPETVVADSLSFDGTTLVVDGDAYDLGRYDNWVTRLGGVTTHILSDLHPFGIGVIAGRWKPLKRGTVTIANWNSKYPNKSVTAAMG